MSVYSQYRTGNSYTNSDIIANESYSGLSGAFKMIQESSENEHAIFEAVISQDFAEAYNKIDSNIVSESELASIQEANISEIWSKVVEFINKIGEKIAGIIKTLRDKIEMLFIKDGKELVKKFGSQVNTAFNQGKLAKMKFKYAAPKAAYANTNLEDKIDGTALMVDLSERINVDTKEFTKTGMSNDNTSKYNPDKPLTGEYWAPISAEKREEYIEKALSAITGGSTDSKSFGKDFDAAMFEEDKEQEGLDKSLIATIIGVLEGSKGELETLKKNENATKKTIKELKDKSKKTETEMKKLSSSKEYTYDNARLNAVASQVITLSNIYSSISGRYYGSLGSAIKKNLKQCRAIFVKAATYNPKQSANEQVELLTGLEESSNYEVDEMFDAVLN